MKIEVNAQELAVLLDGVASIPLNRSYNMFNRLMQQGVEEGLIQKPVVPSAPLVATPEGDKGHMQ
jgi:hypothetical protein